MGNMTFEEINEEIREEIYTDIIQEFDYIADLPLSGDQKQGIISDIVDYVFREWQKQPVCECDAYGGTD
tara:strand:- start:549 stop:755 length:207 start_codon:yes stop_codon:yes gene_type:complete